MKLTFICGSLELGRDGVGDYTRRLAFALQRSGVGVTIISINDHYANGVTDKKIEGFGGMVSTYRLPSKMPWVERSQLVLARIKAEKSDWVSLQFVPFTFHPKGICFRLRPLLLKIKKVAKLHLMVHEPWLLWNSPLSWKLRALGMIQKLSLHYAFIGCLPDAVSTSLPLYKKALSGIVKEIVLLPLFGNIPVASVTENSRSWLAHRCGATVNESVILAGFFGQISHHLSIRAVRTFVDKKSVNGHKVVLLHAGNMSPAGKEVWDYMADQLKDDARFVVLGRLSEQEASHYFCGLDCGLTSYSTVTWGKSGVVAAMREHNIEVVPCGDDSLESAKNFAQDTFPSPWNVDLAASSLLNHLAKVK